MSDDKLNLELGVNVRTEGTEQLTNLDKILLRIKAAQDQFNSFLGKGGSSQAKAAKEALQGTQERMRVLRMQFGYEKRERDALARDEQRSIREAGRLRSQENRRAIAEARELQRANEKATRQVGRGLSQAGLGAKRLATTTAAASVAGAYAAKRTVDTLTRSAVTIDDAITQAQIHVFGEQDASTSRKSAETLRKRLMPVASKLGTKTAEVMGAYVEAAQAGISDDLLDTAVEQGTKYARMNKLNVPDVLEQSGYAIQGLKSFGKVTNDTLKSYFDETSYIIATTSANRQELLAATKTGMAAGASVGMDRRQTLAVLGSIVGVGGEGGQASRMLSTQGSRVANWRNKGQDILRKHHRTAEDRQFMDAVQILGYRDSDSMADAFSKDFFGSLVDAQSKIKSISDPLKRKSITAQLFGKEFGALLDSVIMGGQLKEYREKLDHASGFLNHNWQKFTSNLGFLLDKIGVVLGNVTESMGLALRPIWLEVSQWVDRFKGFDRAGEAVTNFTNGLLSGFGASSVTELLNKIVGDPAKFTLDMRSIFLAGKGFAEGVSAVASGVKSLFSAFVGKDANAQAIGKLTGEIIALGGALTILAPALVTLASLTALIRGLAAAAGGAASLVGGGTAGGTAAGAAGGGVASAAAGGIFATLKRFIPAFAMPLTMDASKGDRDKLTKRLGDWADKQSGKGSHWVDPPARKAIEANTKAVKESTRATEDAAKKAAESEVKKASDAEMKKLTDLVAIRHPSMTGTVGGGSSTMDELRSRGFLPSTPNTTPNGAGGMPTADAGGNVNVPSSVAMTADERNKLGLIQHYESGGRNVMNHIGDATHTAQGLYQLTNTNWRNIAPKLGISAPNAMAASAEEQTRVALHLLRNGGIQNWSNFNPKLRAALARGEVMPSGGGGGSSLPGMGGQSTALDNARRLLGAGSSQAAAALGSKMTPGEWCADFVNGALKSANIKGISGSVANSFLGWGQRVTDGIKAGDVVVTHRGGGVGQTGGHVGLATGETRMKNGRLQYQTVSGNHGNKVGEGWEYADSVAVRRAQQAVAQTKALVGGINRGGSGSGQDPMQGASPTPASPLSMPTVPGRARDITGSVPQGGRSRPGSAGGGNVTVHIGSVHGGDAKAIGDEVGRRTREAVNGATHDVDPGGFA